MKPVAMMAAGIGLVCGLPAFAQSIGVLQSAETIDRGTFKLMGAPIFTFGKDGADDEFGLAFRGGYGFSDRFDAEAKLGFFENVTYLGADGEVWVLRDPHADTGLDVSVAVGLHGIFGKGDYYDIVGIDLTPGLSGHVTPSFELCLALDAAFESIQDAPEGFDDSFTRLHLVPGLEYRISDEFDLVGEFGIGLNDDSFHYVGAGIAYYLR